MFGYIYKTTNLINNKIYIGKHNRNKFDNNYVGSGRLVKAAIQKYGFENFKCEMIDIAMNLQDLNTKERFWIEKYHSTDKSIGYNLTSGGDGGDTFTYLTNDEKISRVNKLSQSITGRRLSDTTKLKLHNALKCRIISYETRLKISQGCKGKPSWLKNKHLSDEAKQNLSIKCSGWHHTNEAKMKISKAEKGRKLSDKHKRKISLSNKNKSHGYAHNYFGCKDKADFMLKHNNMTYGEYLKEKRRTKNECKTNLS